MLATAPEEIHSLGLLMVEALLRLDQVDAVSFGAQMPIRDIVQARKNTKWTSWFYHLVRHSLQIERLSF